MHTPANEGKLVTIFLENGNGTRAESWKLYSTVNVHYQPGDVIKLTIAHAGTEAKLPEKVRVHVMDQVNGSRQPFDLGEGGSITVTLQPIMFGQPVMIMAYTVRPLDDTEEAVAEPIPYTAPPGYTSEGNAGAASPTMVRPISVPEMFSIFLEPTRKGG